MKHYLGFFILLLLLFINVTGYCICPGSALPTGQSVNVVHYVRGFLSLCFCFCAHFHTFICMCLRFRMFVVQQIPESNLLMLVVQADCDCSRQYPPITMEPKEVKYILWYFGIRGVRWFISRNDLKLCSPYSLRF